MFFLDEFLLTNGDFPFAVFWCMMEENVGRVNMRCSAKILSLSMVMCVGFTMTSYANRFDAKTHIGPITEEDAQDIKADLAEQDYLNNLPSLEYDENTQSYYEDNYTKAAPGSWVEDENGKWFRLDDGGYYVNGWVRIDGNRYFFDESGYVKIGWIQNGTIWYYTDSDGVMVTGDRNIDGVDYYFNARGVMQS